MAPATARTINDKTNLLIIYHEYDVNNKILGQPRDKERFVRGSKGRIYYTNDHYISFVEVIRG